MPTEAVPEILPDSASHPEVVKVLDTFSGAIRETVRFGTHVLTWCAQAATGGDEHLPLLLSFRRALEILDSISILVRESSIDPCNALLRAFLEVLLGAQYILQADTKRRAMSFMAWYFRDRLKSYRKFNRGTPEASQFTSQLSKDRLCREIRPPMLADLHEVVANAEAALRQAEYVEPDREYERLRSCGVRNPRWYSLFGGPKNAKQLAERVGLPAVYEILYHAWSRMVHGTDVIERKISVGSLGRLAIYQIRLPTDAQTVTSLGLSMAFEFYRSLIKHYAPNREGDFDGWYLREIRTVYTALSGQQIIRVL